jgi:nucleoside-diphosphate-sugar epimerase
LHSRIRVQEQQQKKRMRVLITGGFGNVGFNSVRYYLEWNRLYVRPDHPRRVSVTIFDKQSPLAKRKHDQLVHEFGAKAFRVIWGDITQASSVKEAVANQDAVVHLAAFIPPPAYGAPDLARRINVDGTRLLIEAMNTAQKPPRFVFASSYTVCGPQSSLRAVEPYLSGKTAPNAQEIYGGHKSECEQMIKTLYKGEWSILRIAVVSISMEGILNASPVKRDEMLVGVPIDQKRHGVHSKDCAAAFCECAVTDKPVHGKTLMIGGDFTWMNNARTFFDTLYGAIGIIGGPPSVAMRTVTVDEGYYYETWMDTCEAQQLLRFQRRTYDEWPAELYEDVPKALYAFTRVFSPLIRFGLLLSSPYTRKNWSGKPYPEQTQSFAKLLGVEIR